MTDLLVALYQVTGADAYRGKIEARGITVRRAMPYERRIVIGWVADNFGASWSDECATAFGHQPIGCYLAVKADQIVGFSCLDTTFKNFIGPIGVAGGYRQSGVGGALLQVCLKEMAMAGYAYAIIGDAGEPDFFRKVAGASIIDASTPGPYPPRLKHDLG